LRTIFDRVVVITPRESIAQETYLVTRQGILRRFHQLGIDVIPLAEPCWTDAFEREGRLEYAKVYGGARGSIEEVAFFAYSTPRAPEDALFEPLRSAGVAVHLIGDARVARNAMAATAEGHAVGRSL
jgi:hypothetical protein